MRSVGLIFGLRVHMRPLLVLAAILATLSGHAQGKERTIGTDSGTVVLHYFTNGKVSTKAWMDKDQRWGRSWAYRPDGSVIVEHATRRIAGHASVHFTYHANGAVSKAEYSDAPDAGIQWYRSTTTFDEQGNKTGFTEQGHDDRGIIPGPGVRWTQEPDVPTPVEQQVMTEQRLFVTEVFVVNASKHTCRLKVTAERPSPALQSSEHTMAPGDTIRIGSYSTGELYEDARKQVTLHAARWNRDPKGRGAYRILREEVSATRPEARTYYLFIGR